MPKKRSSEKPSILNKELNKILKRIFRKAKHPFRILRQTLMYRPTCMNERKVTKQKGESMGKEEDVGLYGGGGLRLTKNKK